MTRDFRVDDTEAIVAILKLIKQYGFPEVDGPEAMKRVKACRAAMDIAREYKFTMLRKEAPPISRLYTYFHASNAILMHKGPANYLPTSSTVHLCLGSMRPILCPGNNFVEVFDGEIMKYSNLDELRERLIYVFEGRNVQFILSNARKYIIRNSASNIANTLMRLARSVK